MKERIGELAGKVFTVLKGKKELSIIQLAKAVPGKSVEIYMALGWLARENKIMYRTENNKTYVSLFH